VKRKPELDERLESDLRGAVEVAEILELLRRRSKLTQRTIATATGSTVRSVRAWEGGVQIRQQAADRVRYLAEVVAVLSGTLTPLGIGQWLHARNRRLDSDRPIYLLTEDADRRVLAEAEALADDGIS
jgi:DNA-binding transcriptional regulator YiaG